MTGNSAGYYGNARADILAVWPAEMRGARVLELGCGTGATIRLLRERGLCA